MGDYITIPGSFRAAPQDATLIGDVPGEEHLEVSIYLREREDDPLIRASPHVIGAPHARAPLMTRDQLRSERCDLYASDVMRLAAFAHTAGLAIEKQQPERRLVKLAGSAAALQAAFRFKLYYYSAGGAPFRVRTGWLYAPADLVARIDAVLGFDSRPAARPKLSRPLDPHALTGGPPNQIGRLYGAPATARMGGGQCIALIELGGGYRDTDNQLAFKAMQLSPPTLVPVSVSGGRNRPGSSPMPMPRWGSTSRLRVPWHPGRPLPSTSRQTRHRVLSTQSPARFTTSKTALRSFRSAGAPLRRIGASRASGRWRRHCATRRGWA